MTQKSALEHLADKAEEIKNNPAGKYDCTYLAREMKKVLKAEGKPAEVVRFGILNQYGEPQRSFTPINFPEKRWNYHDVCCSREKVYDPLVGKKPIPLEKYSLAVFRTEIPYQTEDEVLKLFENAANRGLGGW